MRDLVFKLVMDTDTSTAKLKRVDESLDQLKEKGESGTVYTLTTDADGKIRAVAQELDSVQQMIEEPKIFKISAAQSLATIRDVKIAVDGIAQVVRGVTSQINLLLDANLKQKQAMQLANHVFGEGADEMARFATQMQNLTNYGDDDLVPLMVKLSQTFKLNQDEIKAITPLLLDFTDANKATGMTVESAFDLMGRALNGHTEMLGRYGIELDAVRLKSEGVSYLVEKLAEDYGGTAQALADLRTQNANAWGDIKEEVGGMLETLISPILKGIKAMIEVYNNLSPVMKGFVAGLSIAIPLVTALATGVTALIAAINALKVAINPLTGIISLAVGALTVFGFSLAAASQDSTSFEDAQVSLTQKVSNLSAELSVEAEKFNILASRLLELRSLSSLTSDQKSELHSIINKLNGSYSDYLRNINLETDSYNDLKLAISQANSALLSKMTTQAYENILAEQVDRLAKAKVDLAHTMNDLLDVNVPSTQDNFMTVAYEQLKMLEDRFADWSSNPTYRAIRLLYDSVKTESDTLKNATQEYNNAVSQLSAPQITNPPDSPPPDTRLLSEAQRLIEELARIRQTETAQLEAEYARRLAIIQSYLAEGSAEEIAAREDLDAWKSTKEADITAREKAGIQARFESEVSHLANLRELGISSYDQLKAKMDEYYQWAKENLPKEEATLVLKQVQEVNLRWGLHQKDKEDKELAHQRRLQDIRSEFAESGISAEDRAHNAKLVALQRYFEDNKEIMLKAGLTSEQITQAQAEAEEKITAESEARKRQIREQNASMALSKTSGLLGRLGDMQDKESRRGFETWKATAMAQAYVDMSAGILGAFRSQISIPIIGPILAAAEAAVAAAFGMKQIANIKATKFEPPKAATGGLLSGPSHSHGGILIEAEGDEYITAKDRVRALGKGLFDFLNFAPLDQVKAAFANLALPSLSLPPSPAFAFASGGSVASSPPSLSILEAINEKMALLLQKNVHFEINVDPLSSDPVKVSEIAEQGTIIRSSL